MNEDVFKVNDEMNEWLREVGILYRVDGLGHTYLARPRKQLKFRLMAKYEREHHLR